VRLRPSTIPVPACATKRDCGEESADFNTGLPGGSGLPEEHESEEEKEEEKGKTHEAWGNGRTQRVPGKRTPWDHVPDSVYRDDRAGALGGSGGSNRCEGSGRGYGDGRRNRGGKGCGGGGGKRGVRGEPTKSRDGRGASC
jgi:hypothetical protein